MPVVGALHVVVAVLAGLVHPATLVSLCAGTGGEAIARRIATRLGAAVLLFVVFSAPLLMARAPCEPSFRSPVLPGYWAALALCHAVLWLAGRGLRSEGEVPALLNVLVSAPAILIGLLAFWMLPMPSMVRIESGTGRQEAGALGDVHALIAAEADYARRTGGRYGSLECLVDPARCPGAAGPRLLDARFLAEERGGYRRRFHAGQDLRSFAYVATPVAYGGAGGRAMTGRRSFCGDDTGRICFVCDGRMPGIQGGRCPADCMDMRY